MKSLAFAKIGLIAVLPVMVSACAKSASEVQASYASPLPYEKLSCSELASEAQRVSRRASELAGVQDGKADDDAIVTGVAVIVFWPAAFLIGGDDHTTAELARMKGEFETIEKVAEQKKCGLEFRKKEAEEAS